MTLKNRIAIVTGGSRGIGKAIAMKLAKEGAIVIFTYQSNEAKANETLQSLKLLNEQSMMYQVDITHQEDLMLFSEKVMNEFGRVDILVNNAGITEDGLMLRMTDDQMFRVIETNLMGVWRTSKVFLKALLKSEYGRIINISSVSGILGNAGQSNYSASKAGVIGLTKSMAREFATKQVLVNAVAPGFTLTDMTTRLSEKMVDNAIQMIPLKRMGHVDEIASVVRFLASDEASYITGQTIIVDGGMVMS
jgi:3-oxoacyl-[acyl-carrier protein] reductase